MNPLPAVISGGFGMFRDEFYYVACSGRLAWGYVDQPPLSIFFLRLLRLAFGDSLPAMRLASALAVALLARVLIIIGGDRQDHLQAYEEVILFAVHENKYAVPSETDLAIWICRKPKFTLEQLWPRVKDFG